MLLHGGRALQVKASHSRCSPQHPLTRFASLRQALYGAEDWIRPKATFLEKSDQNNLQISCVFILWWNSNLHNYCRFKMTLYGWQSDKNHDLLTYVDDLPW